MLEEEGKLELDPEGESGWIWGVGEERVKTFWLRRIMEAWVDWSEGPVVTWGHGMVRLPRIQVSCPFIGLKM